MIERRPDENLDTQQFIVLGVHPPELSELLEEKGADCVFEGAVTEQSFELRRGRGVKPVQQGVPRLEAVLEVQSVLGIDCQSEPSWDVAAEAGDTDTVKETRIAQAVRQVHVTTAGDQARVQTEEIVLDIEADAAQLVIGGLRRIGRVIAERERWQVSHAMPEGEMVHTISWPGIPSFAHIDVPTLEQAAEIAQRMGIDPAKIQHLSQAELFKRYSVTPEFTQFIKGEIEVGYKDAERLAREVVWSRAPHLAPEEVDTIVNHYLGAEAAGKQTHGLRKLCWDVQYYNQRAPEGPQLEREGLAFSVFKGNQEIGPIAAQRCVDEVIAKAKQTGIATVAMKGAQRFGVLSTWTEQIARAGLVGILTVSTEPFTALHETKKSVVGTNPLSIAVPNGDMPIVYDASFSKEPMNTVWNNKIKGEPLPEDTFLDQDGNFTTDPHDARAVSAFGGKKGSALAVMLQFLSGPLMGVASHNAFANPYENAFYFQAIDPTIFASREEYDARTQELVQSIKEAPLKEGFDEILLPGERSSRNRAAAEQNDRLVLNANVIKWLQFLRDSA